MAKEPPKEWGEAVGWGQTRFFVSPGLATPVSLHPPSLRPAKSAERPATSLGTAAIAPNPAPGRTARGKKLFRYFSTFLTYLVKIADELIRIMSNLLPRSIQQQRSNAERQSCCAKPGTLC